MAEKVAKKDFGQFLLEQGLVTFTELESARAEAMREGRNLADTLVNRKTITPDTLATARSLYCGNIPGGEISAVVKEVASRIVKNLITAAREDGSSWIYLIPVPNGRTEVFFVNAKGTTMSFFVVLVAPPFSELASALKATERAKTVEAVEVIRAKI
ncbi:MAG: hypothetical protein Q7S60_01730 [bacterium]|nr:hypothetical protein [bacterium]